MRALVLAAAAFLLLFAAPAVQADQTPSVGSSDAWCPIHNAAYLVCVDGPRCTVEVEFYWGIPMRECLQPL